MRTWSNRYHFNNGSPSDSTHWTTFSDAIVTAEKAAHQAIAYGGSKIVETFGYDAGSEVPVFTKAYTTDGTFTNANFQKLPGDCAALIRYSTATRTHKNHPLYLFNYMHGAGADATLNVGDTLLAAYVTALGTYAAAWIAGFSDGTTTHHRCGPNGDLATGSYVNPLVTHRDLPHA